MPTQCANRWNSSRRGASREDLIAGTAEQLSYRFTREDGCFRLETRAECEEMIARQTGAAFIKDGDQ